MVYHCECPVKETYNTCALALARSAREAGVTVVLAGEGADELFGGYPGYRFDAFGRGDRPVEDELEEALEEELRERVWGDRRIFYEKDQVAFREIKKALYSPAVRERFRQVRLHGAPAGRHASGCATATPSISAPISTSSCAWQTTSSPSTATGW